jgi:proline dehydrogenase
MMSTNPLHGVAVNMLRLVPKPVVWRFSRRYIAGTGLDDAFATVHELNASACRATIDVLGEDSSRPEQVEAARTLYLEALGGIYTRSLDCGVSIKLSEMGLRFDEGACRAVMRELLEKADELGIFVRIDMEDSSVTDVTLDIYRELRADFDKVGTVIQSCLRRSEADVAGLLNGGRTDIRLCKGIYIEAEDISYRDADEIRDSFRRLLEQLLDGGAAKVGIATHDPALVRHAEDVIEKLGVPQSRYEFQMLLGVAEPLRRQLVARGHPLRVYVPFGDLWFEYSLRRLRENPNIAGHIVTNLFKPR